MTAEYMPCELGRYPWDPSEFANPGEVLDRWNFPRMGLIEYGDTTFLFSEYEDTDDEPTIWVYAPASRDEVDALPWSDYFGLWEAIKGAFFAGHRPLTVVRTADLRIVSVERRAAA